MRETELKIHCGRCEELWSIGRDDPDYAQYPYCGGGLEENWEEYSGHGYDFRAAGDEL